MRFSDVEHQERALSILRRALRSGRTHHAYLLEGPEGVGKELAGRALGARLLCADRGLAPDADACGTCGPCRLLATDNHPDFHLIHRGLHKLHPDRAVRARKGLFIGVDVIRHFLIEPAGLKPTQGARRVFLLRDAERMNEEAQNALLKTLEEPPGSVVLLLVTASAERLLPTIRSRCQRVPFDLLPPAFVAERLAHEFDLGADAATALARLSEGRLGVAVRWRQLGLLERVAEVRAACELLRGGRVEAFGDQLVEIATALAAAAADEGADDEDESRAAGKVGTDALRDGLKLVFLLVGALLRDALVAAAGAEALCGLPAGGRMVGLATLDAEALAARLECVRDAEWMLDRNVAPKLVCERLGVGLMGE